MRGLDHRGHGRGIRSARRFRLADCADDAVALADVLGVDRFIPVGYSMGGLVAQLVWHRHRDRVDGLVLGATARNFRGSRAAAVGSPPSGPWPPRARFVPAVGARRCRPPADRPAAGRLGLGPGPVPGRATPGMVLEAGQAIGNFSSRDWIGEVDVPTAVVLTERDRVVAPHPAAEAGRRHPRGDRAPGAHRPRRLRRRPRRVRARAGRGVLRRGRRAAARLSAR